MRRHADVVEMLEHILGDTIVEHALAFDHLMLLGVEGGGVVLEMLNQRSRLGSLIEDLRLAFIDSATTAHRGVPWLVKVHSAVAPVWSLSAAAESERRATRNCGGRPLRNRQATRTRCGVQLT